jgi:hypothetical protein
MSSVWLVGVILLLSLFLANLVTGLVQVLGVSEPSVVTFVTFGEVFRWLVRGSEGLVEVPGGLLEGS